MIKTGNTLPCLLLLALCAVPTAGAHQGHHDEAAAQADADTAASSPGTAPGAALDTPQVELVAQREGADIVLYLDDYASDAPLQDLQVSVRSGNLTLQAAASGDGAYRIPGDLIDGQAAQPLQITVHGPGLDAELQTVLPPAPPATVAAPAEAAPRGVQWAVAAGLVLLAAGGAWLLWRRREGRTPRLGAA